MSKGNVNIEPVLAVVMRGKNHCGAPLVIQQCISHSLEALLLHHCYLFKLTGTADPACFCVSERPSPNKSRGHEYTIGRCLQSSICFRFCCFLWLHLPCSCFSELFRELFERWRTHHWNIEFINYSHKCVCVYLRVCAVCGGGYPTLSPRHYIRLLLICNSECV